MRVLRAATQLVLPFAMLAASVVPAGAAVVEPLTVHRSSPAPESASLEQCVSSPDQEERAATFSGEMTALPGTARMEMRVDLLERGSEEEGYRRVTAPGLGVWRLSTPGVKSFRYLKQVTNLAAPASYRGAVRFRWLNARGHQIAFAELRTRPCEEAVLPPPSPATGATLN